MPRALSSLQVAYQNAADQAERLANAQSIIATGESLDIDDIPAVKPPTSGYSEPNNYKIPVYDFRSVTYSGEKSDTARSRVQIPSNWKATGKEALSNTGVKFIEISKTDNSDIKNWILKSDYDYEKGKPKWHAYLYRYASGGYVDYTGPAWVDGTKNKPEYMLNAKQTIQFENLISALDILTNNNSLSSIKENSIPKSIQYNLSINVDQISSDYDVDQMVERVEKKILDASKYRNINILKKSN